MQSYPTKALAGSVHLHSFLGPSKLEIKETRESRRKIHKVFFCFVLFCFLLVFFS